MLRKTLRLTLVWLSCVLLLNACAQIPAPTATATAEVLVLPKTTEHWFEAPPELPSTTDFYQLSAAQQQQFLDYFNAPAQQELVPQQRLYRYLEQYLANFNYEGKTTLASDTMNQMSGNCMSLALLVSALAQLVDVEVGYRATYTEPMLDFSADIMLTSAHVRSYLFENIQHDDKKFMLLRRPAMVVDYFPGRLDLSGEMLKKPRFDAMMYNNLAADAMIAGDLNRAYWLSQAALKSDARYSPSINMIAIIYRRKGDVLASQQWYEFGLRYSSEPVTLASNYLVLAQQMQNQPLITRLKNQFRLLDDNNPYVWFYLAYQAEQSGEPKDAVYFYQKLVKKAPYLHKANLALAKLQFQLGNPEAARRALHEALQYSYEPANRQMYLTKLQALTQQQE
ncbi:MAG: hypothetical protein KKF79_19160 [Gammaproteobacteria bacterium]|nr:hypothetical protein [Gammaproteobacteria bacterium]